MTKFCTNNILVTGANQGIGRACAEVLARASARIAAAEIIVPEDTIASLAENSKPHLPLICDVADETSVDRMFVEIDKRFGLLDAVVHCARIIDEQPLPETTTKHFDRVIATNLRDSFLIGREAIRRMQGREGRVVLTSSDLGVSGRKTFYSYAASKHGVIGLTRSWAKEFAPHILVNALCPGPIDTEMLGAASMSVEWRARELDTPIARFGYPEEVAQLAAFLVGPHASYITGQGIGVNGGSVM